MAELSSFPWNTVNGCLMLNKIWGGAVNMLYEIPLFVVLENR